MVYSQVLLIIVFNVGFIGWAPLHSAAMNGHLLIVEALVKADADKDIQNQWGIFSSFIQTYI